MITDLTRYEPLDLQAWSQQRPPDNPVDEYIAGLKRQSSKTTMLQALGAMASIFDGEGRPEVDRTLTPQERKVVADAMKEYARQYDWFAIDDRATQTMLADLKALGYAKSSQGKMIAAVVGVLQRCMRIIRRHDRETRQQLVAQWHGTADQLADTMKMLDAIVGMRYSATQSALDELSDYKPESPRQDAGAKAARVHRELKSTEVKKLFAACAKQGGALGARNQVMLALGIGCGLRRSEIAALRYEHVDWEGLTIGDDPYLPIRIIDAKGNKDRTVNASNGTRQALLQWAAVRGNKPGPLLYSFDRWTGMQTGLPIDGQTVYNTLVELAQLAGVNQFAPHDMRRTFVSGFIGSTKDVAMASKLAGHASITTTMRYDVRDETDQAKAVIEAVHVPFELITVQPRLDQAPA